MELMIKKEYFDMIKNGIKKIEYRDAHITFKCETTGDTIRRNVIAAHVTSGMCEQYPDVLEDKDTIVFLLE